MPRTLADMNDDERKALLNNVFTRLVEAETEATGKRPDVTSPVTAKTNVPVDLAPHLNVHDLGGGLKHAWDVNGICAAPNADRLSTVRTPIR
jgi:hypothetical protein